jgi:hypothetical protein
LNFDGDFFARVQARAIDLAERSGGNRLLIDLRVSLKELSLKLRFNAREGFTARKRRHLVLQLDEFPDVRERQQVAARAERLPDLDKGGAELD